MFWENTLGNAADRAGIHELVARFDDAVNRRDADEFRRLWTTDAVWEIGHPMPLRVEGRDSIVKAWQGLLADTEWLFRGSFVGTLRVGEDEAAGRWPCVETGAFLASRDRDAQGYDNRAMYVDLYAKQSGNWLFKHRRCQYLWLSNERLPGAGVHGVTA